MQPERIHTPSEAAQILSVSDSMLRRYARTYEQLGGTIPKPVGAVKGRLYPQTTLNTFKAALTLQRDGVQFEEALKALMTDRERQGQTTPEPPAQVQDSSMVLATRLLEALETQQAMLERQQRTIEALQTELREASERHTQELQAVRQQVTEALTTLAAGQHQTTADLQAFTTNLHQKALEEQQDRDSQHLLEVVGLRDQIQGLQAEHAEQVRNLQAELAEHTRNLDRNLEALQAEHRAALQELKTPEKRGFWARLFGTSGRNRNSR